MRSSSNFLDHKPEIIEILENITKGMVGKLDISMEQEGEQWRIELESDDNGLLIGHQGENLLAIQHILRTVFHAKNPQNRTHFILDVGGYRKSRERYVSNLVRDIAYNEVLQNGCSIIIKGLNSYERRLVHQNLSTYSGLETSSIGEEGNRKLVIRPSVGSNTIGIDEAKVVDITKYEKEFREKELNKSKK